MTRHLLIAGAAIAAISLAACGQKTDTKGSATPAEQAATPDANPAATVITPSNEAAAPDFVRSMNENGFRVVGGTPARMDAMIQDEIRRWGPVVKATGLRID